MNKAKCSTLAIEQLNEQIYCVRIQLQTGEKFLFKGGQYLFLLMSDNRQIPLSIASAPEETNFIELHIRVTQENSLASEMLALFESGQTFQIMGPSGNCYLKEDNNENIVIIAGGTGFSPMKSLLESAFKRNSACQLSLYLGAQSSADLYLSSLVQSWTSSKNNFTYVPVIASSEDGWLGQTGLPHEVAIADLGDKVKQCEFYIGGSEAMVINVYNALQAVGVLKNKIHSDMLDIKRATGEIT
ncbi:FAD-binding oxidoreductase [Aliikangiella sp. IMCC44359]|uniref:FAD-binding oxidoreductase n=1 Tax=Aliikangiella sp. IMCC44359 TaxID=3459125 RepID=UPI00403A7D24